jgi:hypothetical protein
VSSRSPGPFSMTTALTRGGMPWSGQINNRAVAAPMATTKTTATNRQCFSDAPAR